MPTENAAIRRLLEDLRGGGFNASITLDGVEFDGQKVVGFENGTVLTVDQAGVARMTVIAQIRSVDF
ncbi:MAG: hypothetical protein K0R39_3697 [Symbiobacteriaceae bacterium]|jgi:hypothetical protein|nr:hypothetical protein [Symbiobacteriaceae bacterium]